MSYLDVPRIVVAGSFYADPSTVNNDPNHYDPSCTDPSPWQEPTGNHWFRFVRCAVTGVLDQNGQQANGDPLFNRDFASTDYLAPAKLVDIDVYQQGLSTVYGMQVSLDLGGGTTLVANMDPASLNGVWFNAVTPERGYNDYGWGSPGGDSFAAGTFQTWLRVPPANWPASGTSPVLDQLRAATITDAAGNVLLSFRFVTDGYINSSLAPIYAEGDTFDPAIMYRRFGRVTMAIGPVRAGEAEHTPAARWLLPRAFDDGQPWEWPAFNQGPCKVDATRKTLTFDLANSIARQTAAGPFVDLGTLTVTLGGHGPPALAPIPIGTIAYQGTYMTDSAIVTLPLGDAQLAQIATMPIGLVTSRADIGPTLVLTESLTGLVVAADQRVVRLASDTDRPQAERQTSVDVWVTQWGAPAAGVSLSTTIVPVMNDTPGATVPPTKPPKGDTPQANGALTATITATDATGHATMTITVVRDPGSRDGLDSQLYFVYPVAPGTAPDETGVQEQMVCVLAWASYATIATPQWTDVSAILAQYDKLYPGMRNRVALTDEPSFTIFMNNPPWFTFPPPNDAFLGISGGTLPWLLTRGLTETLFPVATGITDPRYMPVTRDLSPNKILTVLNYIRNNHAPTPPPPGATVASASASAPAPAARGG